jgi:hypothetical protein
MAGDYNPIPMEIATMDNINAQLSCVMPTLDIHSMPLECADYQLGLNIARNFFVHGEQNTFAVVYTEIFLHDMFDKAACDCHYNSLGALDYRIRSSISMEGHQLERVSSGFHFARVILDVKDAWNQFMHNEDLENFVGELLHRLDTLIDIYEQTYGFLFLQSPGHRIEGMPQLDHLRSAVRGGMFGRLQHIAYLTELIVACFRGEQRARNLYLSGFVTWQIGWMTAPRNVADVVQDLVRSRCQL